MDKSATAPSAGHNIANRCGIYTRPNIANWGGIYTRPNIANRAASPPIARCSRAFTLGPCKRAFRCAQLGFSTFSVPNRLQRSRSFPVKTGSYAAVKSDMHY